MAIKNPYVTLGVDRSASVTAIKRAHRRRVRELHPDRHPNADEGYYRARLASVNEAWEVLGDPEQRKAWDEAHPRPRSRSLEAPHPPR